MQEQKKESERDEALIQRFVSKDDREAFETLIKRHLKGIRRLLYGLLNGDQEDMKDAEQETLLSLFKTLSRFRGHSSFKTFLYRIAKNKAIDLIRKRKRETRIQKLISLQDSFGSCSSVDPFEQEESRQAVLAILERIRPEEKTLFLLKEVEKLSLQEISQVMGIAPGTVKSRLHRTREKIVRLLGDKR